MVSSRCVNNCLICILLFVSYAIWKSQLAKSSQVSRIQCFCPWQLSCFLSTALLQLLRDWAHKHAARFAYHGQLTLFVRGFLTCGFHLKLRRALRKSIVNWHIITIKLKKVSNFSNNFLPFLTAFILGQITCPEQSLPRFLLWIKICQSLCD